MARPILIATDGSELAGRAVAEGVALARVLGAPVIVVNVAPTLHTLGGREDMFAGQPEPVRKAALDYLFDEQRRICDRAADVAHAAGVSCRTIRPTDDHPYRAILQVAKDVDAALITVASHGRSGITAMVLGSETAKLLAHADRPVLVCR